MVSTKDSATLEVSEEIVDRLESEIQRKSQATPLTKRELVVLRHVLSGADNTSIALTLGLSFHTVKNHVYHIFQKTGAGSRTELLWLCLSK